jgi:hypothetical protein
MPDLNPLTEAYLDVVSEYKQALEEAVKAEHYTVPFGEERVTKDQQAHRVREMGKVGQQEYFDSMGRKGREAYVQRHGVAEVMNQLQVQQDREETFGTPKQQTFGQEDTRTFQQGGY